MLLALPEILRNRTIVEDDGWHLKEPYTDEEKKAFDEYIELKEKLKKEMIAPLPLE